MNQHNPVWYLMRVQLGTLTRKLGSSLIASSAYQNMAH
jgi:hypothetical protein